MKNLNELNEVLIKNGSGISGFKEFRVKDEKKPGTLNVRLPLQRLPYSADLSTELVPEIEPFSCAGGDPKTTEKAGDFAPRANLGDVLNVEAALPDPTGISLKVTIAPEKFESKDVSAFHVVLRPKSAALPAWVDSWNMNDPEIELWHRDPASFQGTRTYNLKYFLQTLWTTTQNTHRPRVADLYFYVDPD
jgi:hypothetical protein